MMRNLKKNVFTVGGAWLSLAENLAGVLAVLSVLLLLLELRDGVHRRLGLHLAHLGRVVALHHQHVGHLAVFLLADGSWSFTAVVLKRPPLKIEATARPKGKERGGALLRRRG